MLFKDELKIIVRSGSGGDGVYSMFRDKFNPRGIPDGGNGGRGGSVWIISNKNYSHLGYLNKFHFFATNGENGKSKCKNGANGLDVSIYVPLNTQIINLERDTILCELNQDNEKFCIARGGSSGKGNKYYASSINLVAEKFTKGRKGREYTISLKMKLTADIGIIGAPNAGKSSLLRFITNSKTSVGNYAFTTTVPQIGVSAGGFSIIDIPGLIKDANKGKGMGIKFLKHIEKCKALICILDVLDNPKNTFLMIKKELYAYNPELLLKIKLIVINKLDSLENKEMYNDIIDSNIQQIYISALSGYNMDNLYNILSKIYIEY